MPENFKTKIMSAITMNKECKSGLLSKHEVFYVEQGRSGGQELLAFLSGETNDYGVWFGCIFPVTQKEYPHIPPSHIGTGNFIAAIVPIFEFINGGSDEEVLEYFHRVTRIKGHYFTCIVQHKDDAFKCVSTFADAVDALCEMIQRFNIKKRYEVNDNSETDLRIMCFFGGLDCCPVAMKLAMQEEIP